MSKHAYWCNVVKLDKRMNDEGTVMYDDPCNCWAQYEPQGQISFSEPGASEEREDVSGIVHAVEGNANG